MSRKKTITLDELAAELSLSPTTVSLALSGKSRTYRISEKTTIRIKEAAERLGYTPNHMARAMRRGKSDTIGVIFPDVSENYMNYILAGIESAALENSSTLMIATSALNSSVEKNNIKMFLDRGVDGLLIIPYAPFSEETYSSSAVELAENSGIPVVAADRYIEKVNKYAVIGDDFNAAFRVTEKMLSTGCVKAAYLGFDLKINSLEDRRKGFYKAVESAGLKNYSQEFLVKHRNAESYDIRNWLDGLEKNGSFPDCFLVSTDGLAQKLYWLLNNRKSSEKLKTATLRMPVIARFGEDSPYFPTGMISVIQPHMEIGKRAALKLFSLINGKTIPQKNRIEVINMKIKGESYEKKYN